MSSKLSKLIIIGGGFAGLSLAKTLANSSFDITLIDCSNHHLFQPLLYQVATAALSPGDIAVPIREVLSYAKNIQVHMGVVTEIDRKKRELKTQEGRTYSFDKLVVAVGARHSYFGKDH